MTLPFSSGAKYKGYHCTSSLVALHMVWKMIFFTMNLVLSSEALSSVSMQQRFAVNVQLDVHPDVRSQFLSFARHIQAETLLKEAGALQFVVGEDVDTPNTFYFHQQYENQKAYKAHCDKHNLEAWREFSISEPKTNFFLVQNTPDKVPPRAAFCLKVDLFVKPERLDEFLEVINRNKKGSDELEPLCLQYVFGEDLDAPNTFHFHEEYCGSDEGKEGFEAHKSSAHFAAWEVFAQSSPFTRPPVVSFFKSFNSEPKKAAFTAN